MQYYANNDYRDYLAHYGILGMHWGIRRFQPYSVHPRKGGEGGKEVGEAKKSIKNTNKKNPINSIKNKIKERRDDPVVKATRERKKQALKDRRERYSLSDGELNKKIERLKKEQQLKDLTDSQITPGRKIVRDIVSGAGKQAISKLAAAGMLYAGKKYLEKRFGNDVAGGVFAFVKKK